ncbi:MAG: hypothetical protein RRA94_08970 [Bacteroidota bacterium]|nr:hypothetical protein [Bacteroidota bacterium]
MNPETHASLQALEKELERLRSAVDHIDQARAVAQKVVAAVGLIQKKYSEHLDALLDVQKEAVAQIGDGSQQRFDEISGNARRHILESAARAKKYLEEYSAHFMQSLEEAREASGGQLDRIARDAGGIVESAGSRLEELTEKAASVVLGTERRSEETLRVAAEQIGAQLQATGATLEEEVAALLQRIERQVSETQGAAASLLKENSSAAAQRIAEIGKQTASAVEQLDVRARHHVEEVGTLSKTSLQEIRQHAEKSIEETGTQSKRIFAAIKKTHDQQSTEFEKVTVSADALIAASGKLVRTIDAIDFPTRLQSIESDIRSLHYNLNSAMSRLDALEKSSENAMAAFSEEVVNKLGRLEAFTDKAIRGMNDGVAKALDEQQKQAQGTRTLIIIVLLFNLLLAAGLYLVWSGQAEHAVPVPVEKPYVPADTLISPAGEDAP